jgi:hypothetical protein
MEPHSLTGAYSDGGSQVLWEDGERVVRCGWRLDDNGKRAVLVVLPAADRPSRSSFDHLTPEYELRDELDGAWAVRPLDLVRDAGRTMLVLEDAGGEPSTRNSPPHAPYSVGNEVVVNGSTTSGAVMCLSYLRVLVMVSLAFTMASPLLRPPTATRD